MDTFREPTPEEAQFAVLQFMGQHLTGDLKMLESNLISRNQTLNGMTIKPENVLRSVAAGIPNSTQPVPAVQEIPTVPIPQPVLPLLEPVIVQQQAPVQLEPVLDKDQLEFNFNSSPYTVEVFDALKRIEDRLLIIADLQSDIKRIEEKIDSFLNRTKKKD
jgi:hypothetical protein